MYLNNAFLYSKTAISLYENIKSMPIFDFHNHISPKEIYEDKVYENIGEIWLKHDHYKWRIMRGCGIEEKYITGDVNFKEKFLKYCDALGNSIGNPLYHWSHIELEKYFLITTPIDSTTAEIIYEKTTEIIKKEKISPRKLLSMSKVSFLGTTDDPIDELKYHKLLKEENYEINVCPTFRPDNVLLLKDGYFKELSDTGNIEITNIDTLFLVLEKRLEYFIKNGCCAADCGIPYFPNTIGSKQQVELIFKKILDKGYINFEEYNQYLGYMMVNLAKLYRKYNIVMQLHLAVIRNVNQELYEKCGVDSGNDSIGDIIPINHIAKLFNAIGDMPKTIVYTLNPSMYYPLATLIGEFNKDIKGKIQLGSAWWFNDCKEGIFEQLKIYSTQLSLGTFVGMLTDSRSFLSFGRHDYFRRILCSQIGEWIENGELVLNDNIINIIKNICYYNAKKYFLEK